MADPISVTDADARIRAAISTLPEESATLPRAIGRQLLSPIVADRELPPFHRAMMDGIAFSSDGIEPNQMPTFTLAGLHAAGNPPPDPIPTGEAWEIMTGAAVPPDCDTVVPYEDLSDDHTRVLKPFTPGQFIHPTGSDSEEGEVLVPAGVTLGAPEIAIAASVGQNSLAVPCRPRVGILSTGDEAVHPAIRPDPWQIRRSNGPALAAVIDLLGLPLNFHQHAPDDESALRSLLDQAFDSVDLLIISGGISKGKKDYIRELLDERLGAPLFHGVTQRPGKPLAVWSGSTKVFALPGNPVSALATFARYVRPALQQLQGLPACTRLLRAPEGLTPHERLTWLAPVAVIPGKKTTLHLPRNSGDFVSISPSTGIIEVPPADEFSPTTPLTYYPFAL